MIAAAGTVVIPCHYTMKTRGALQECLSVNGREHERERSVNNITLALTELM